MKYGIFGDIHANLAALQAVLDVLRQAGCDQLICTGDIVGYGPSPAECLRLIREQKIPCVFGNHDEYVTELFGPSLEKLGADVKSSIQWSQNQLSMEELKWLAQLPRHLEYDGFSVVHGALGPNPWMYIVNRENLHEHFTHQTKPLAFNGHTHLPLLGYQREGTPPVMDFLKTTTLPDAPRVLVNSGSVGQPRDRDPRAACCIYDTEKKSVQPVRVPYDIAATQALIRAAKLPERYALRIAAGK